MLTQAEEIQLASLLAQEDRERVSTKMELFRQRKRIKVARGGRGAGAKSWGAISIVVQRAHREKIRVLCTREIQQSLEESVHRLVTHTVERLTYKGWDATRDLIRSPSGAVFSFHGLKDLRASAQMKGYEDVDICLVEEASTVSDESWSILVPTIRKPGSEIWILLNPELDDDPVSKRFLHSKRDDVLDVWMEPGVKDNPWWTAEMQKEMEEDYKRDPDQAEHVWGGMPRKQGQRAVMSRAAIRGAMDRDIKAEGAIEIGVDVARFGDDLTVMYKRHGLKVMEKREFTGQDTQRTAKDVWDLAGRDPNVQIKIDDTGVGGGVTDRVIELGGNAVPVNFGGSPKDGDKYTSTADEMWFTFPMDEADIPNDAVLMGQLSGRLYDYDAKGRKKIESKKDFKKRTGKSPDHADALLLCFYDPRRGARVSFV
jgi:phage terminase large subunit